MFELIASNARLAWAKVLAQAVILAFAATFFGQLLSQPSGGLTLVSFSAGIGLMLVNRLGVWALPGIFLGQFLALQFEGEGLLRAVAFSSGGGQLLARVALAAAGTAQAWLSNLLLARLALQLLAGGMRNRLILLQLCGVGPLACLLGTTAAMVAYGWAQMPVAGEHLLQALLWWGGESLSVLMVASALLILKLRGEELAAWRQGLSHPAVLMLALAIPAWSLAALANLQQVAQQREGLVVKSELLRRRVQARLDLGLQNLQALVAYQRSSEAVSHTDFAKFTTALLEPQTRATGLLWADRSGSRRPQWLVVNATTRWPEPLQAGADLASLPELAGVLGSATAGVPLASRMAGAGGEGNRKGEGLLLLGLGKPLQSVAATVVDWAPWLTHRPGVQDFSTDRTRIGLFSADTRLLAGDGAERLAEPTAAGYALVLPVTVGGEQWQLRITVPPVSLPFLYSLIWWLAQLMPQLICAAIGLMLLADARRERAISELDAQRAALTPMPLQPAGLLPARGAPVEESAPSRPWDAGFQRAWEAGEFTPRFEPIIELATGELRGVEALLRWRQAPKGVITPDIIEWAERKNVIGALDRHILLESLRAVSTWPMARGSHFTVSVNVSGSEMMNPHWADEVVQALNETGVAGRRLCLEITEGVLVRPDAQILSQLARLRANGIKVALDDFGTGYSSIGYLRQLPVDRLKLDRIFTSGILTDPKARQIVASVIALGHSLNIEVVAEGVEDAATAEVLLQLGCPLSQGWLFSKAVNMARVGKWLESGRVLYPDHALEDAELDLTL